MAEHRSDRNALSVRLALRHLTWREAPRKQGQDSAHARSNHFESWYGSSKVAPHSRQRQVRTSSLDLPPLSVVVTIMMSRFLPAN